MAHRVLTYMRAPSRRGAACIQACYSLRMIDLCGVLDYMWDELFERLT